MYAEIPKHGLFKNLNGMSFGRLVVVGYLGRVGSSNCWECVCECGKRSSARGGNLRNGHTQSCGCLHKEALSKATRTHGKSKSAEYRIWNHMKRRCYSHNDPKYPQYGGRGIVICDRWLSSFACFFDDMGSRPSPRHSIDRIDNNGNYEPGNCRWATAKDQANNTRATVLISIGGVTKPLSIWADEYGLPRSVIVSRLISGDDGESLIRPSGLRTKRLTFNGITDTYLGWSNRTGIKSETISQRIRRNKWSVERSLTEGATA